MPAISLARCLTRHITSASVAVAIGLFAITADATAQTMSVGVLGGVNLANMQVTDKLGSDVIEPKQETRTGVAGGLFVARHFTPVFGLQLDALFVQKGTTR